MCTYTYIFKTFTKCKSYYYLDLWKRRQRSFVSEARKAGMVRQRRCPGAWRAAWCILSGISCGTSCARHWGGYKRGLWDTSEGILWSWWSRCSDIEPEDEGKKMLLRRAAGGWSVAWVERLEHPLLWEVIPEGQRKESFELRDRATRDGVNSFYGSEKLLRNESIASLLSSKPLLFIFSYLLQNLLWTSVFFPCSSYLQSVWLSWSYYFTLPHP